jgi:hypothetical protein
MESSLLGYHAMSIAKYSVYVVISDFKNLGDAGRKAARCSVNIYRPTIRKIKEDLNLHEDSGESSKRFSRWK